MAANEHMLTGRSYAWSSRGPVHERVRRQVASLHAFKPHSGMTRARGACERPRPSQGPWLFPVSQSEVFQPCWAAPATIRDKTLDSRRQVRYLSFAIGDHTACISANVDVAIDKLTWRLRAIFEHVQDAIFLKDSLGRYLLINRAGARMLGKEPDQVIGRDDREFFTPEAAADIMAMDRAILSKGEPRTIKTRRTVGGVEHVFFTLKVPYQDSVSGEPLLIGISRDITREDVLERQLAMDEQHASVGALAGGVAHEINNPLTYMLHAFDGVMTSLHAHQRGLARLREELDASLGAEQARALCERAGLDESLIDTAIEHARQAHQGSERVRDIVSGLRSFARPADTAMRPVDLHELLDSAIDMASVELRYRARIERNYGTLPRIRGSEQQLRQLFLTLLVSIARSLPEGESDIHRIHIATSAATGDICVTVTDTGSRTSGEPARELGMSVVRYVAASHKGSIEASGGEPGNQVVIRLPVEPFAEPRPAPERPVPAPAPARASILVVDDEPLVRMMLRRMLDRKHDVSEAESGLDAVRLLENGATFDAILCDLMMPRMTGMDVYDWITTYRPELTPRLGFVTGGVFTDRGQEFMERCTRPVLEKPFDRRGVERLLDQILGHHTQAA